MERRDLVLQGWDIDHKDIEIAKHDDGSEWLLGAGSYGKARLSTTTQPKPAFNREHSTKEQVPVDSLIKTYFCCQPNDCLASFVLSARHPAVKGIAHPCAHPAGPMMEALPSRSLWPIICRLARMRSACHSNAQSPHEAPIAGGDLLVTAAIATRRVSGLQGNVTY